MNSVSSRCSNSAAQAWASGKASDLDRVRCRRNSDAGSGPAALQGEMGRGDEMVMRSTRPVYMHRRSAAPLPERKNSGIWGHKAEGG